MMCVKRYILAGQTEVLASCLVEALIIAAAKLNHQGQQSSYVWEALSTAATMKSAAAEGLTEAGGRSLKRVRGRMLN